MIMFLLGMIGVWVIWFVLVVIMCASRNVIDKLLKVWKKIKIIFCAFIFTIFSFVLTLIYLIVSMLTECFMFNAAICTLLLVISWFLVEGLYKYIADEVKNNQDKVLLKEDKNICMLFALIGVVPTSLILCYENRNIEYISLIGVAVSIWIGAYIPISEIFSGKSIKEICCIVGREFKSRKITVWISSIISTILVTVFASNSEIILKLKTITSDVGMGIVVGSVSLLIWVGIYQMYKDRNIKDEMV